MYYSLLVDAGSVSINSILIFAITLCEKPFDALSLKLVHYIVNILYLYHIID